MSRRKHPISNRFRHLRFESLATRQLMAVDFSIAQQPFDVKSVNGYSDLIVFDVDGDNKRDDMLLWTPGSGDNRLLVDGVSGSKNAIKNAIDPRAINGEYTKVVAGDFDNDDKQDDLFFWTPVQGSNRAAMGQWYQELAMVKWTDDLVRITGDAAPNRIEISPLSRGFQIVIDGQKHYLPPPTNSISSLSREKVVTTP